MAIESFSGLTCLVVDDDDFMLKTVEKLLASLGVKNIFQSDNAQEALRWIANRNNTIDIVISDLKMPEMDGIQLLRHLGALGVNLGIILISGEDPRLLDSVRSLGEHQHLPVLGALTKPIQRQALAELLHNYRRFSHTAPKGPAALVFADELQSAISNRQITAYYQPQIAIKSRRLVGVEALARWPHPEKGMISPTIFIGIAEKHGMIRALTDCIFQQSVRQAAEWRRMGFDLTLSVNFSAKTLCHLELPEMLYATITDIGLTPVQLVAEITESTLAKDMSITLDILTRMRLKGFGLSIDDFGTGFSSLEQLRQIPFNELKIDRSFVRHADGNKASQAILESSVGLARKLNIRCVAEGVEEQVDWDLVESLGCDCVQGFHIARPMSAEAFVPWAREYTLTH